MKIKFTYYKPQLLVPTIGLLWSAASWGLAGIWGYGFIQGIGPTVVVMGLLTMYDRWLWKFPIFNLMNKMPDLSGRYEGEITFNRNDIEGNKACNLEIKQTCSNIKVKSIFTKESENDTQSTSTEAFIKTDDAGDHHLYFYYHNLGSCKNGDTLDSHDGINVLEILKDKKALTLTGFYFTNRNPQTKGCMQVTRIRGAN